MGRSLAHCLAQIFRNEGLSGLWKGSLPSIVKAAPSAAITFTAYESIASWLTEMQDYGYQQQPAAKGR